MTSFTEIIEKCGICGTFTKHMVMLSTNSFGSPDLDLRPPGMKRHTMDEWLQECPKCGYVSVFIGEIKEGVREIVEGEEYSALHKGPLSGTLANRFLKASLISECLGNRKGAGTYALYAAWAADDVGDRATARTARLKAAEHFMGVASRLEKRDPTSTRAITLKTQTVDILRRSGRWEEAEQLADSLSEQQIDAEIKAVINFQKSLLRRRNDSPHRVNDIIHIDEQNKINSQ